MALSGQPVPHNPQKPMDFSKLLYIPHAHKRGLGYIKVFGTPASIPGAKMRGAMAWLERGDRRQLNIFPDGKIWCEQQ